MSIESRGKSSLLVAQIGIVFIWAGLVLGLSFIETPLKFRAPGITEVLGVGIGRLVFRTLNRVEIVLTVLLFATVILGSRDAIRHWLFGVIAMIVLMQTCWLLPVLDARAQLLLDGNPSSPSFHHLLFIGVEVAKLLALFTFGVVATRRNI